MTLSTRQYLKTLEPETRKKLFELANLTEQEYWLLFYAFVDNNGKGRMRDNTCMKLNIGTTKYHTMLNEALIKVDFTINSLDKVRTL